MEISTRTFSCRRRSILKSDSHLSHKLQQFMLSPLASWVKTFDASLDGGGAQYMEVKAGGRRDCQAEYLKLVDGVFLNRVMRQIDPNPQTQRIYRNEGNDEVLRVQNLTILVQHIKAFYQDDLQQLILMTLPNVQLLGRDPLSDEGLQELEKLLLLLLGCAVQCERKEEFIGQIQTLDLDTQATVAGHIQEITQNEQNMVPLHWPDLSSSSLQDLELLIQNMADHMKDLVNQRDENMERITELIQEQELCQSQHVFGVGIGESMTSHRAGENRQHLTVQLADCKSKLRRLRQEFEEKSEELQDRKQELEELQLDWKRLQKQNRELVLEARTARTYRDEVDVLREKATRVDRLQSEVKAYKERLNSIEFYRGKVEEEREYSKALLETKAMLEEQLETARSRCDKLHELEKENLLLQAGLQDLEMERDTDRRRIEQLMEENLNLEMELKKDLEESEQLSSRMETMTEDLPHTEFAEKPLSYEVHEVTSNQLLRLERENQDLRRREEQLRVSSANAETSTSAKILNLERENQQLQRVVERLRWELDDEKQNLDSSTTLSSELMMEKERIEGTVQTLRESCQREVQDLKMENEHLRQSIDALRQRSQVSAEVRVKDIEKENKILHEAMMEASLRQSSLESERKQALLELEQCRERADKAEALAQELGRVEKLNEELRKRVLELEMSCGRVSLLEDRASGLEAENRRLQRSLEGLAGTSAQLEASEAERARLELENLHLRQMAEMQEVDGAMMSQLESENTELRKERDQLRREVNQQKASIRRAEELALAHQGLQAESQRLARSLENTKRQVSELEKEAEEMEMEAQSLRKELEEERSAAGLLEQARDALAQELEQAERDKRQLGKESRRLRQQAESRDASLDQHHLRLAGLEQENRQLQLGAQRAREAQDKLGEAEAEKAELLQRLALERKASAGLREA
ncbi:girdin-like, partial [Cetorhinus maximus]